MNSSSKNFCTNLLLGFGISAIVGVASFGVTAYAFKDKDYIAIVNGSPISAEKFKSTMNRVKAQYVQNTGMDFNSKKGQEAYETMKKRAFRETVILQLVLDEANKRKIVVTDKEVDKTISDIKNNAFKGDETKFKTALAKNMFTLEKLQETYNDELKIGKLKEALIKANVKVNDADINEYYQKNKVEFTKPEQVSIAHIVTKEEATAKEVIKKLDSGEKFEKLAEKYSLDKQSAKVGGVLGFFSKEQTSKEFSDISFALKDGEYTKNPLKTQFGFHVIKRLAYRPFGLRKLADVKEEIRNKLFQSKTGHYLEDWKGDNLKTAKIEYNVWYENYKIRQDEEKKIIKKENKI